MPRDNSKFMAPVQPDAALAVIVGAAPLPRSEITKRLWAHIHAGELQDATNRRMINCDGALSAICGQQKQVSMFDLPKFVKQHVSAIEG